MSDEWQAKKHQEPSAPRLLVTRHSSHATLDYQHDTAGNLLQDGTGTGTHSFQWDAEGR